MSRKSKNIRSMSINDFYCTKCGNKGVPIIRTIGQDREPGHLKKLFCLTCQEERNMVEIRNSGKYNLNSFWIEYKYGNFTENGERKEPWRQFINKIKQREKINNWEEKEYD